MCRVQSLQLVLWGQLFYVNINSYRFVRNILAFYKHLFSYEKEPLPFSTNSASTHTANRSVRCVILGFCREIYQNCALLGYYAASCGNFLSTFRDNLSVPSSRFNNPRRSVLEFLTFEDGTKIQGEEFLNFLPLKYGTNRLSRNIGKEVALLAAL